MSERRISGRGKLYGTVEVPGDKSISHRALLLGALAHGTTVIEHLADGRDVQSTVACLQALGVPIEREGDTVHVPGVGLRGLQPPDGPLDVGNSGTTIRLLAGILAGQPFATVLTGDASIRRRPMARVVEPLRKMGADISASETESAPLTISGGELHGIAYTLPVASAQVKSCVLLAGLFADGPTQVQEPVPTRDHTELLLQSFGADISREGTTITLTPGPPLQAQEIYVPGDLSSAAFWLTAALLVPDSELQIRNVGINPTRRAFLDLLLDLGAEIELANVTPVHNELVADLYVRSSRLRPFQVSGAQIPQLIDELPVLAVLATQAEGVSEIRDAEELRYKESDRLRALRVNLQRLGAQVEETEDGLKIQGPTPLRGGEIETFGDHRIAMAFAVAALLAEGESRILDPACVEVSYPGFFDILEKLQGHP